MLTSGPVIVVQLPEQFSGTTVDEFMRDLHPLLDASRPRVVLDCSQVHSLGSDGVEMLLLCMEEAMKRDGDVKLAALSDEAVVMLELMRVDRLFEIFETSQDAANSFAAVPAEVVSETESWRLPFGSLGVFKQAS